MSLVKSWAHACFMIFKSIAWHVSKDLSLCQAFAWSFAWSAMAVGSLGRKNIRDSWRTPPLKIAEILGILNLLLSLLTYVGIWPFALPPLIYCKERGVSKCPLNRYELDLGYTMATPQQAWIPCGSRLPCNCKLTAPIGPSCHRGSDSETQELWTDGTTNNKKAPES